LIFHQVKRINKDFVSKIEILIPFRNRPLKTSFSLVQLRFGDDNDQVTEETVLNPDSEGGKQLAIVEGLLQETVVLKLQYCVLGV
jgi:hypothetical protein